MCELSGTVYFGNIQKVPFSSAKQMEIYNEPSKFDGEEFEKVSFMLEFLEEEDKVELLAVY